jgi:hypothetical protein
MILIRKYSRRLLGSTTSTKSIVKYLDDLGLLLRIILTLTFKLLLILYILTKSLFYI